jgi:hypothetical protein
MLMRKLRAVRNLPAREKSWLLPLFFASAAARAALLLAPFRMVAPRLGTRHGNIPLSPLATDGQIGLATRIGALTASVARCTPWQSKCLVQAIMATALLKRYGIPYVAYLGVAKADPRAGTERKGTGTDLFAHAWVVVGPRVVSGAAGCNAYTVVSAFVGTATPQSPPQSPGGNPGAGGGRRKPLASALHP